MITTWILVADAARARLFSTDSNLSELTLREEFSHPLSRRREQDLVTDRPGRGRKEISTGARRTTMDPASSALDAEAEQFAEQLADELGDTLEGQANARLVLVAAPHVLGSLRKHLDPKTAAKVSASLDRDYTWMDAHELIGALRQGLAPSA